MKQYDYDINIKNKSGKKILAKSILWFLGRGLEACTVLDNNVKNEIEAFSEGSLILLKVEPTGPSMLMKKTNNRLKFMGLREEPAELTIYFKNIEAANLVLTGRTGIAQAYGEHRVLLKGNIALGMCLVRCLCTLEAYLFPAFITKKILSSTPEKSTSSFKIYISTLFGSR